VSGLISIQADNIHSGNGASDASSVDMNGRFVAFASRASNLTNDVINNTGQSDIFVRDTCRGEPISCVPSTFLMKADNSAIPNADVVAPAITADGLHVAFESGASNFAGGVNNGAVNVFIADVTNPQQTITFLVSRDIHDAAEANGDSHSAAINGNGRFVAFESVATNLVFPAMTSNPGNVFLFDTCLVDVGSGCSMRTILVSADNAGKPANALSDRPSVSADGRFVAFQSLATNLLPGVVDGNSHIYLRDTCTGAPAGCTPSTILVSDGFTGGASPHNSENASVSSDGRFVAFDDVVLSPGSPFQVFARDTCIGVATGCTPSTSLVSVQLNNAAPDGGSRSPSISADGRFIAYASTETQQVPGDTNGFADVFVRDTCMGAGSSCTPRTVRVSVRLDGTQGNADSGFSNSAMGRFVNISGNGLAGTFVSAASNLVDNDTNNADDVFLSVTGFSQPANTPAISALSPSSMSHGSDSFVLTVRGALFLPGAQAQWNGSPRDTTYINSNTLEVFILFSDIGSAGSAQITVVNPSPGGTSAPVTFTIN